MFFFFMGSIAKRNLRKENVFPVADFHCQLLQKEIRFD